MAMWKILFIVKSVFFSVLNISRSMFMQSQKSQFPEKLRAQCPISFP